MNIILKLRAYIRLEKAIRMADEQHIKMGRRFYVMPTSGTSGELIIMDRDNFRILKRKHYINQMATTQNLEIECFYCTPYKNGNGKLSPEDKKKKRKQYYSWVEAIAKSKKNEQVRKH